MRKNNATSEGTWNGSIGAQSQCYITEPNEIQNSIWYQKGRNENQTHAPSEKSAMQQRTNLNAEPIALEYRGRLNSTPCRGRGCVVAARYTVTPCAGTTVGGGGVEWVVYFTFVPVWRLHWKSRAGTRSLGFHCYWCRLRCSFALLIHWLAVIALLVVLWRTIIELSSFIACFRAFV